MTAILKKIYLFRGGVRFPTGGIVRERSAFFGAILMDSPD